MKNELKYIYFSISLGQSMTLCESNRFEEDEREKKASSSKDYEYELALIMYICTVRPRVDQHVVFLSLHLLFTV